MIKDREYNAKEQRRIYEEQLERLRRARGPEARAKPLEIKLMLTDAERIVREFEEKGLSDQCLSDTLNYGVNKFFMHLDSNHLITEKNFKSQISKITN